MRILLLSKYPSYFVVLGVSALIPILFMNCSEPFRVTEGGDVELYSVYDLSPPEKLKATSRFELLYAASDLLGDVETQADYFYGSSLPLSLISDIPPDQKDFGFDSVTQSPLDESHVDSRLKVVERIVDLAFKSSKVFPCAVPVDSAPAFDGCIQNVALGFVSQAFARILTEEEVSVVRSLYEGQRDQALGQFSSEPIGYFDLINEKRVAVGWALDETWSERQVEIHFYADGPYPSGTFVGATIANSPRPDVNTHFNDAHKGNYGFYFQLPPHLATGVERTIYAYAIGNPHKLLGTKKMTSSYQGLDPLSLPRQISTPAAEGLKAVFQYALLSPKFQIRNLDSLNGGGELAQAKRLALFLSSSIPDADLIDAVKSKTLRYRLDDFIDKNSKRIAFNLVGQWFGIRDFAASNELSVLEKSMVNEAVLSLSDIIENNLSIEALLKPNFTYLNKTLANHYSVSFSGGSGFQKVIRAGRGGLLEFGIVHRLTAPQDRTSPVIRGKKILGNLLCQTIDPPSADLFKVIAESKQSIEGLPVHEQLAVHRAVGKSCQKCHERMDPIGLALESYSPFGLWRTNYADGKPVVASAVLDGVSFKDAKGLIDAVAARDDFKLCMVKKVMAYALGRNLTLTDEQEALEIQKRSQTFKDVLVEVALSKAFSKFNSEVVQ